jgi:hypothetical protein
MVLEKGLPNSAQITVRRKAGAVYDLLAHRRVAHRILENGDTAIDVNYTTNDGRVFLVVNRPLGKLDVRVKDGGVAVYSPDKDVMIPVGVFVKGRKPYYGVIVGGKYHCPVKGAEVKVLNLADGREYKL